MKDELLTVLRDEAINYLRKHIKTVKGKTWVDWLNNYVLALEATNELNINLAKEELKQYVSKDEI